MKCSEMGNGIKNEQDRETILEKQQGQFARQAREQEEWSLSAG
jgi:hypothetical protein